MIVLLYQSRICIWKYITFCSLMNFICFMEAAMAKLFWIFLDIVLYKVYVLETIYSETSLLDYWISVYFEYKTNRIKPQK